MARFGWCYQKKICFWILFSVVSACFVCCRHTVDPLTARNNREIFDHHRNRTTSQSRTTTLHLEGLDLRSNSYLAFTSEQGAKGTYCNESYFIVQDIPVTSIGGSAVEFEVNTYLQSVLSTSWHLCVRQQTLHGKRWIHIGTSETYPSSALGKRSGDS